MTPKSKKFTQGAIVNTLSQYLDEMNVSDGLPYSSYVRYDDSKSDPDSNILTRLSLSCFAGLKGFARTLFL